MSRARNLSDEDIARIVEILDGWTAPLRWELLIAEIERRLFVRYTRQALHKHARIKDAFSSRKRSLTGGAGTSKRPIQQPELQVALDRIERLTAANQRLEDENRRLLEQFVRWAYNASMRNLDQDFLNQPLPTVDREQTSVSRKGRALVNLSKRS